jgi:DNA adenine methylase
MTNIYPLYSDLQKPTHSTFRSKRRSTLAYTGGKTRGVPSIVPVILHTLCQIGDDKLVSPFLGGGSVELACQAEGVKVYGYDIDPNLISFYYYLLNDPNQLANEAQKYLTAGINGNHHAFQQLKKLVPALPHSIQKAAGYFVVNRLSYGGLTFSGGNKAVNELKPSNIENIRTFSAPNLSVSLADYRQALLRHGDCTLAYLDPPYDLLKPRYYYGENGNRHRGFDHEALFKTLRDRPNWIMSYNADAPILARYEGFPKAYPCWTYSMNNSRSKEVVIFSKDLAGLAEWAQAHFTHITATNDNVRAKRDEKAAELMAASPNSTPLKCAAVLPMTELESQPSANEILPASASGSPPRSEMVVGWSAPDLSVISETKTPAPLFPRAVLGEEWGGWCSDVATGANAHFDYVAMAVITAATGLIGNSLTVRATASFHQPSVVYRRATGTPLAG